jgi:site-specific DNA-methyltransferase (adenine-specific)
VSDHRVICADCLGPEGLATLADKSVDHVITDPPYEAEAHTLGRRVARNSGYDVAADYADPSGQVVREEILDFPPITEAERAAAAREFARVVRRWVVVFCQVEAASSWREALAAAGLVYRRTGVWVKPDGMPQYSGDRPGMGYESLVIAHAPGRSIWNGGGRHGVWTFNKNEPTRHGHQTQKPLVLMEALVRDFTDPGDLILDAFAGSGTTGVAAKRLGRRFVGFERDEKYWRIAVKRIDAAREQFVLPVSRGPEPKQASFAGVAGSAALKGEG